MKIVHLCMNGPYTEGWGYQENIITKYHALLGHQVTILANTTTHTNSGEVIEAEGADYTNNNGVRVIRCKIKHHIVTRLDDFFPNNSVYHEIKTISPDLIMVHGMMGNLAALQVKKYLVKDRPDCFCVADIHQDLYNSPESKNKIKYLILRTIHRILNGMMYPHYRKVYYVAPSALEFARRYYNVPENKLDLLPLGCDPEFIKTESRDLLRQQLCNRHKIKTDDIIICHGGKMNQLKGTLCLVEAVKQIQKKDKRIKLILFGTFQNDIETEMNKALSGADDFIFYVGHLSQQQYYDVLVGSDIAVFPGSQSALWQQAIACGLAMVVKEHVGTDYLDLGGNIRYLKHGDVSEILYVLGSMVQGEYLFMKDVARKAGMEYFSYKNIAQKVIQDCVNED